MTRRVALTVQLFKYEVTYIHLLREDLQSREWRKMSPNSGGVLVVFIIHAKKNHRVYTYRSKATSNL